ncbi:MAG: tetratricopeptide repeat protein [Bacteroidetes bacterium]|nr:tetratricopeptide repeat protein [Bacteroidota bacterium]
MFETIKKSASISVLVILSINIAFAQKLTHSISDKAFSDYLEDATGLKMLDDGRALITSSHKGALLTFEAGKLTVTQLQPSIFKDNDLSGIDQLQNGNLLIANEGSSLLAISDGKAGKVIKKFSQSGSNSGELSDPVGIAVSVNNRVYVADRDNNRVSSFNTQGLFLRSFGNPSNGKTDLVKPTHISIDAEENVYVLESGKSNRVSIFKSSGQLIKQITAKSLKKQYGKSIDFSAMTVDLNGRIFLADNNLRQIFSYDWRSDKIIKKFGALGQSRGQYRTIAHLSINNKGQLAVVDTKNEKFELYQLDETKYRTPILSNTFKFNNKQPSSCQSLHNFSNNQLLCAKHKKKGLVIISEDGQEKGQFASDITQFTAVHSGADMVAILVKNKLHTYKSNGEKIFEIGRYGTSPGGFIKPEFVYSAHNQAYVSEKKNNRIQVFAADGQFIRELKSSKYTFKKAGPVAVDSQKNIYIADRADNGLIKVIDLNGKLLATVGSKNSKNYSAKEVFSIGIDSQDRLYALVESEVNDYSIRVYENFQQIAEFGSGDKNGTDVFFNKVSSMTVASSDKNSVFINDIKLKQQFRFDYHEIPEPAFALKVHANKKQVLLKWDSSKSPLIARYEVQGAVKEQGPYKQLASTTELTKNFSESEVKDFPWFRVIAVSGLNAFAKPSKAKHNQFHTLHILYKDKQFSEVISLANRLLKISPKNADALELKASSQLLTGQYHEAILSYKKLEVYPQYKNLSISQQVKAFFELEEYLEAKSLIDQVLAQQPTDIEPYLICTELSLQLNDAIGAVTCAEDGLAKKPQNAKLRYLLGKAYILAGIEDQGLAEYQAVIKSNPNNFTIRTQVANELLGMGLYEQALEHFDVVVSAKPAAGTAILGKATCLLKLDRDSEAKALAIKLSGNPKTKGAGYYVLGKIALKQGKYTEAVLRLTRASKTNPENVDSWISLANAYIELNQPGKGVSSLQQGVKANPDSFELSQLAGKLELEQEHFNEAITYLDKAVTLNPQSLLANKLYARSLFSTRNYRSASSFAEKAAKIAPKDTDVLILQADIANQSGKVGSAIEFLKTAISIKPASADFQYRIGKVYLNANLFDSSRQHLEKAASINPSWSAPLVALGDMYSKRRQFDEAIMVYEKAVELDPSENNRAILNTAFSDKKKSLEFKNNAPQLTLSNLNLSHVFSAAYKQYTDKPIGSVNLKNVSATDYGNLKLSFQIKEYMDFPVTQDITSIKGNESQQHDIKVTFNNKILEVDEDIGVQIEVKLSFLRDGQKDSISITQPMTIYGKNAMVWGDANMVGSFVTPKDDTLRDYVRSVVNEYQPNPGPLNEKIVAAMTYFSGLNAAGTKYIIDPNTPYTELRDDQVDYVQFPRETLKLKSGDCDDLSVLLSAGLENLGIETSFIEVPGHLFMMFNTGLPYSEANLISQDNSLLIFRNKQVWIPLESTMINSSFNEAWAEGARKYQLALAEDKLGIIDLKKAWTQYKPVTLRKSSFSINLPDAARSKQIVKIARAQLLTKSIDRLILPYQSIIQNNPKNISARLQIAILYSKYGLYDEAEIAFDALKELAPDNSSVHTNYGNMSLLNGDYDSAIASYQQAAKFDDKDGGILINLSMANYRKGNLKQASKEYQQAISMSPHFQDTYSAYSKLLSQ